MRKARILVVDDDERWLHTVELILAEAYDLVLASSSGQAEARVRELAFDLAILDQRMFGDMLAGVHLLAKLREIRPGLQGIVLTGFAAVEDAVDSMKSGVADYISKGMPNLARELQTRVQKALDHNPLRALVARGEGLDLEFKSSARWDLRQEKLNKDLEKVIVKTVAAFLNSERGGILLIGVDDQGDTIGLEPDYRTLTRKPDKDGFQAFLISVFGDTFGKEVCLLIAIEMHDVAGKDVCRVTVKPAPNPVYVNDGPEEHLYVRSGNRTDRLSTRAAVEYCKMRWKL